MTLRALAAAAAALVVLIGCSKEKDVEPPAELVDFKPTVKVDKVWSASVAGDEPTLRLGLGLAVDGERAFAAGHGGEVAAFNVQTGAVAWRVRTKSPLSGGPGAGAGLVAVGSSAGDVIALEQIDGRERWRVRVSGEVLAAPAISERVVVVRTVDGRMLGLAPADGKELWRAEQQIPRLTLRGTSSPAIAGDVALCGFDNGRLVAVNPSNGEPLWDAAVSPSRGRTELERLVDIDSSVKVSGADVFVVGFQGRAAMLALDSGQVWWSREISSNRGLDFDDDSVFVASADGELVSLRRRTGVEVWRQKSLRLRRLSAPASIGPYVVVADFEGYVHWFDKTAGDLAARVSAGGRVTSAPVVAGDTLLVIDDKGRVSAFRYAAKPAATVAAPAESAPVLPPPSP